jgi:hypothetical protein
MDGPEIYFAISGDRFSVPRKNFDILANALIKLIFAVSTVILV